MRQDSDLPARDAAAETQRAEERAKKRQEVAAAEQQIAAELAQTEAGRAAATAGVGVAVLHQQGMRFTQVAFSPDCQLLASVSDLGIIQIWDLRTGLINHELPGHGHLGTYIAFSPDGETLAATTEQNKVWLWNVKDGKRKRELAYQHIHLHGVAFSPDGMWVLASGLAGFERWDAQTGKPAPYPQPREMAGMTFAIRPDAFAIRPDARVLASTTATTKRINLWNLETGQQYRQSFPTSAPSMLTFSPDGWTLAVLDHKAKPPSLKLINLDGGAEVEAKVDVRRIGSMAFSPDGKWLVLCGITDNEQVGRLQTWDVAGGKVQATFESEFLPLPQSVVFSPAGTLVATTNLFGLINIWSVADLLTVVPHPKLPEAMAKAVRFVQKGKTLEAVLLSGARDAVVPELAKVPGLNELTGNIGGLTENGFAELKNLKDLRRLDLEASSPINEAWLRHLKDLSNLQELSLSRTTAEGCAFLKALPGLRKLRLLYPTDDRLAHLKDLTGLQELDLPFCREVTDAGFAQLSALTNLK